MRKIFMTAMGLVLLSGCGTTSDQVVRTNKELKYKKILVMPFIKGAGGANASIAQDNFLNELSLFPDIQIIGQGQMDATTIKNLGVTHPDSFGSLDFSPPQGDERRKKVLESFPADAIIFGSNYIEQGLDSLVIQMMNTDGAVVLSFTKEPSVPEGLTDETTVDVARKAAQKTIDFLKENETITRFHRR